MKGGTPYLERAQPWGRRCQWLCGILVGVLLGCRPSVTPPEVLMDHLDTEMASSVRVARAAVIATPQSGSTWGHLGQVFQAAGYPAEACLSYQQATRIDPG